MAGAVKAAEVAGEQPSIHNRLCRKLWVVEVVRHHSFAAYRNLADAFDIRLQNSQFNARQGFADGIRAKRFEVVERKRCACLRQPISICHRNSQIVKELQG